MEATSAPRPHALRLPKPRKLLAALSDERLVDQIRHGDAVAFEILYDRYSSGILGFCRHMLGSVSDAEDAVQHTFIAAHADIERHDKRDLHVKAWLYTIARNRCLSMLRARREQPSDEAFEIARDNLVHDVEHREDIRALLGDIAKLPEEQREALVLAEVGDLSHSDIADVLGCEVGKVKSLVFQARTALIDRRAARETPCEDIREQLATLRGGALRRSHLRHHLEACPGCSEYREEIRRQRAMLAVALPVVPSAALKSNVLGALGLGGSSAVATAGAGGSVVATAATASGGIGIGGVAAKLGAVAVLAAGGVGGATVAGGDVPLLNDSPPAKQSTTHPASSATGKSATATGATTAAIQARMHKTDASRRSAKGSEHGFTPVTGESNGARAREFAKTRGQGAETSAAHRRAKAHKRPAKRVKHVVVPRSNVPARTHTAPAAAPAPRTETTTTTTTTTAPTSTTTTTTTTPTSTQPSPSSRGGSGGGKSLEAGQRTLATGG